MNNNTLFKIPYGLYIITTQSEGKSNGCVINTFIQVTSEPLQVICTLNKNNYTTSLIQKSKKFNISILSELADFSLLKHFGFQSGKEVDKFAEFKETKIINGIPIITKGTNAYFCCDVIDVIDLESHYMFIARVLDADILDEANTLTYGYYQQYLKPKAKKAIGKTIWRCKVCGYEIEIEELPDDYICPVCKHPKSDFEKIIS